ncbi:pericentriolar material 1 protein-like isoform X1 [Cyprinus carpio]|uniref:Pericentriolar material 1 protein-like isoform X1 n=1 Tax=Cyprinus carpio TaxID=7962 RepID=A0A9Q9VXQ5_CYPCA|nr:pericentriolar material 1 protein-like isoform X1 [Cyprinus carpio]XP_042572636.1 pericentriolar material 1 protein-like isoform X1 [Cyprinus carpio]
MMATGGTPFEDGTDEQELHNWSISNGSLDDRLNNMDWGVQQKKANRSSEKNRKKFSAMSESRLTNDISPESTPGAGRRRARTPHSFPHVKYSTQMSVPDQAELDRLRQVINFTDLDERSIGSDSQGRVTAANNQRQLSTEAKKPFNFLPIHLNTNKSKEPPASTSTPGGKEPKKQSHGKELFAPVPAVVKEPFSLDSAQRFGLEDEKAELCIDSSQVVSKLVQIREYIGKATSMRDDLVEKNDVPANVERLSLLITHLKEQEKSYLRFLQKMLARENEDDDEGATVDSAVGSGSVAESTSLNLEPRSEASSATGHGVCGEQKEELENMRKQHDLLKKMLEQQEQLRALQGRQAALLAMQQSAEQAIAVMDDTVVTETTGSVSGRSITSELNDELNDLIQRFHNQLHDSQSQTVPDNRRQAECLSLSREVCRSRTTHNSRSQLPSSAPLTTASTSSSTKITKLHELQDKKQTMDKILQELHSLRDQTLNNSSCQSVSQRGTRMGMSERPYVLGREGNGPHPMRQDSSSSYTHIDQNHPADKLRKLKEVHKRLNELKELVQYYEQTSDMVVDTVNENVKEDDDETEDGSLFEAMFDSEQENHEPVTNIRNPAQPQTPSNWMDMNSLGKAHSASNNRDGRLNTECEINNRSAANLCSLNVPSVIECQFNRDRPYDGVKDEDEDEAQEDDDGARGGGGRDSDGSGYSHRSSLGGDTEYAQKVRRLQTAKQKLRQLQELVAMVQSDDTDGTTANEDEGLKQQPNNTRATAPKIQRDIALSEKTREKLYEEKLKQQQQELKQLHEERQRLMEIQGKIQDLQWACPDLQSSVSSSVSGQMRKIPAAASTPAPVPLHSSSSAKANTSGLKPTTEPPPVTVTDNELWSEMRRHQMLREELRQRRKHLESLMAEQQRRSTLNDSPFRSDTHETQSYSRDERTVATWGGSTQCPLGDDDDDDYSSEVGAEEDDDDEHDEGEESSSTDELHACSIQKQRNYSSNNRDGLKVHREINGSPSPRGSRGHPRQQPQTERGSSSRAKRQENLRWAADLSLSEGAAPAHWQEQITHLQKQLNFSTTMCQTLLQDQQTLSYMLQALLTGPYGVASNNVTSPQIPLIMHQLNQCYTQLAWQQNNVNRLKQVLNDLLQQQQSQSLSGQQQHQNFGHDSASSSLFVNYPPVNTLNMPGLPSFSSFPTGFNYSPVFPSSVGDFQQNQASSDQQHDPNISLKTEYMSFPPSLQRSPLNNAEKRFPSQPDNVPDANNSSWLNSSLNRSGQRTTLTSDHQSQIEQNSPSSSPVPHPSTSRDLSYIPDSQESVSSLPDRADPTTVTKTFRAGRKAAAQASLASRDKTPNTKSRRRRGRGQKNTASVDSDSASSDSHFDQDRERSSQVRYKDLNQGLLDKLTQEKLDSKTKNSKPNDLSSAYAWRTPFLSNRIACTEVPDVSSDFSLFEALRETIYSEVATLISQNESRPHFLIELFHELQLLNTDYLRQRALYSLQEIVTRHLTEKSVADEQASSLGPTAWATGSQSELTPSESLATSDNDTSEKIVTVKSNSVLKRVADRDSMDNESLLSTSSNLEPFASDDLGNTVIHLDKALARMRKYERMKLRAECNTDNPEHSPGAAAPTATSALTKGAGHSSTDAHCPQIDTQQLDRQIKAIMTEVIPFLKEHVGEVCSHQLLTSVRRMVLKLTRQNDESKEFVQFFHRQLGGILQDSLSKFVGRTLQDCGEDLLVEISEILFNELAFFRLMQDLDQNTSKIKHKTKRCSDRTSPKHSPHTEEVKTLEREKTFSPSYFDEDRDQDETEQGGTLHEREEDKEKDAQSSEASEVEDEEGEGLPLSISLSKAETQALCNYGSGEDENEVEEMEEFEAGPVEVQTSLQASMDNTSEHSQGSALRNEAPQETKSDLENSEGGQLNNIQSESKDMFQPPEEGREEAKTGSGDERREEEEDCTVSPVQETPQSSDTASPDTESPVMINTDEAGSGNTSQRSDEEDFVKVEDLPLQMSLLCEEELCKRISEEQQNNNLTAEILNGNKEEITGLVGNAQALKEPETIGAQSA